MYTFSLATGCHTEFVDMTAAVQAAVDRLEVKKGVVTIFVPHTTAGVTINENADPDVMSDMEKALEYAVPWRERYQHAEGNAAAHVKASMVGSSAQAIVEDGRLQLGTWQGIYFCEFDGPRTRNVWVAVAGGAPSAP